MNKYIFVKTKINEFEVFNILEYVEITSFSNFVRPNLNKSKKFLIKTGMLKLTGLSINKGTVFLHLTQKNAPGPSPPIIDSFRQR